jgi:hypothetical protein
MVAKQLLLHTMLVSCTQAHALGLDAAGYEDIPDLLNAAQHKVSTMHSVGLVTDFELVWHLIKFEQVHNEIAREHCLLHKQTTVHVKLQLGKCLIAVATFQSLILYISHLHFCSVSPHTTAICHNLWLCRCFSGCVR